MLVQSWSALSQSADIPRLMIEANESRAELGSSSCGSVRVEMVVVPNVGVVAHHLARWLRMQPTLLVGAKEVYAVDQCGRGK
ncbi:hypothetical protein XH80_21400 [Bradyrhizobium sp. CCBAU 45384]|nr:hypothetical protein [Bradyrhizobium sp. CCBAU 45384]